MRVFGGGLVVLPSSWWSAKLEITDFYYSSVHFFKWIPGSSFTHRCAVVKQKSTSLRSLERATHLCAPHPAPDPSPACSALLILICFHLAPFQKTFLELGPRPQVGEDREWLLTSPKEGEDWSGRAALYLAAECQEVAGAACFLTSGAFCCLQPEPFTLLPVAAAPPNFSDQPDLGHKHEWSFNPNLGTALLARPWGCALILLTRFQTHSVYQSLYLGNLFDTPVFPDCSFESVRSPSAGSSGYLSKIQIRSPHSDPLNQSL